MLRTVPVLGYSQSSLRDGQCHADLCVTAQANGLRNGAAPDASFGPTGQFFASCSAPFRWIYQRVIMESGGQRPG